ncbi:hypothetical protein [Mucilaginibacter sp. SG564]|uniref:hypothetical protein n=1 Tax=Mucilaginibacter sp. SG564 TaxID=2587022 RepID=UPI001556D837|nr:hypothetical protein [Mucilaginibacter sp. SG564]NOW95838.1 hypothetical protein [Mucilaginibacter sp. SG564]
MEDTIFLLVKVKIKHEHVKVHNAIAELNEKSRCTIRDTEKVKVMETQIMDYKLKK